MAAFPFDFPLDGVEATSASWSDFGCEGRSIAWCSEGRALQEHGARGTDDEDADEVVEGGNLQQGSSALSGSR